MMFVASILFAALVATMKPIALVGTPAEAVRIRCDVLDRLPAKAELIRNRGTKDDRLRPATFSDYAAVVFCDTCERSGYAVVWNSKQALQTVVDYVNAGGTLVFTGAAWDKVVEGRSGGSSIQETTETIAGLLAGGRVIRLAKYSDAQKGAYVKAFRNVKGVDPEVASGGWGMVPLGEPGKYPRKLTLDRKPTFAKAPPKYDFTNGLKVIGPGIRPVIYHCPRRNDRGHFVGGPDLANELAWHLREMTGLEAAVRELPKNAKERPDPSQVALFLDQDDQFAEPFFGVDPKAHPLGTSFLKRKGGWFLIGGNRDGASRAMSYLLEQLGCRYFWPSEDRSGVIIPTGLKAVVFPEIDRTFAPALKYREIRSGVDWMYRNVADRADKFREKYGVDDMSAFKARWEKTRCLCPGGRDFFKWHGVNDRSSLEGDYQWGHYYKDYWDRYHETHPEFFALQPNGRRDELCFKKERPKLCLSNRGLIEETAKNLCERFDKLPMYQALSISLPDAGGGSDCMCEGCRRLDPPNAKTHLRNFDGGLEFEYPAPTDRLVFFGNEVIKLVHKRHPGKKLCFYAYNATTSAPVANVPDKDLVVLTTAGDYARGSQVLGNFASWARFGIPVYWRPNLLWGFRSVAVQNFARHIFMDVETLKVNGCEGTDFDCYYDTWATQGFTYYMLCRALFNPDHLDFDTIADDYFQKGFGKAAPVMKKYWEAAETMFFAAAEKGYSDRYGYDVLQRHLDIPKLKKLLAAALKQAGDDALVKRRIRFFARGLYPSELERRIVDAEESGDDAAKEKARDELRDWLKSHVMDDFPSLNPYRFNHETPCLR